MFNRFALTQISRGMIKRLSGKEEDKINREIETVSEASNKRVK